MIKNKKYGLIGKNLSYSFSKKYFTEKFKNLGLNNYSYENFDLQTIEEFPSMLESVIDQIQGFNVTIPYKQEIIEYLDEIDEEANSIGAVNTIKISKEGKLKGYNTDIYGFEHSLKPLLRSHVKNALILGTGGASKAIAFVLEKNNIQFNFVSRIPTKPRTISYDDLTGTIITEHHLIINCTPIGTFPKIESSPEIPYEFMGHKHLLYDLVYNPEVSTFLNKGKARGTNIKNGEEMLRLQADRSWEIWNS
jgi:shikimate dehydrogenase